jgi:hypothetical protein
MDQNWHATIGCSSDRGEAADIARRWQHHAKAQVIAEKIIRRCVIEEIIKATAKDAAIRALHTRRWRPWVYLRAGEYGDGKPRLNFHRHAPKALVSAPREFLHIAVSVGLILRRRCLHVHQIRTCGHGSDGGSIRVIFRGVKILTSVHRSGTRQTRSDIRQSGSRRVNIPGNVERCGIAVFKFSKQLNGFKRGIPNDLYVLQRRRGCGCIHWR